MKIRPARVAFCGHKGSGKTYAAAYMLRYCRSPRRPPLFPTDSTVLSFADPIRAMTLAFLRHWLIRSGKEVWQLAETSACMEYIIDKKEMNIPDLDCSARYLAQTLGTEWGRDTIHPDIWIDIMRRRLKAIESSRGQLTNTEINIFIDDVRFENEAKMLRDMGFYLIQLHRDDSPKDAHASEGGISPTLCHAVLENSRRFRPHEFTETLINTVEWLHND